MATGLAVDMGGNDLTVNRLLVGAATPGSTGVDITVTEGASNINVGASGTAGTLKVFPSTASKGDLKITATNNTGNTETTLTNAAFGQATVLTIPDPGGASANFVLTAGQNTFAAGTATVAPIVFTAGTNLTTPAVGAIEFDGNALYSTNHASSRQIVDAEQFFFQAADSTADNNTGLDSASAAAVFTTANGAITLVAGKKYFFEACYNITNTGTTSHTWAVLFGGTATFSAGTGYQAFALSSGTANATATGGQTGFFQGTDLTNGGTGVVVTAASTSATEQVTVELVGTIVVNAGGTLIPQMKASARPGASGTPGVVHKATSFIRIWEIPANSVGNWS